MNRVHKWSVVASAVCVVVLAASCGSNDDDASNPVETTDNTSDADSTGTAATGTDEVSSETETLVIATGGASPVFIPLFYADAAGLLDEQGLEVEIQFTQDQTLNQVMSGNAQIGSIGPGASLPPVQDGRDMRIVYSIQSAASSGYAASVEGIEELTDCTRVVTSAIGSTSYGVTAAYKEALDADFDIRGVGTPANIVPAVLSGEADCIVGTLGVVGPALEQGLELLIDPQVPSEVPAEPVLEAVGLAVWGEHDTLTENRSAVIKLLGGLDAAMTELDAADPMEVAATIQDGGWLDTFTQEQLATQFEDLAPYFGVNDGAIEEVAWQATLELLMPGLDFVDPDDPIWGWSKRVDMTYLQAVKG